MHTRAQLRFDGTTVCTRHCNFGFEEGLHLIQVGQEINRLDKATFTINAHYPIIAIAHPLSESKIRLCFRDSPELAAAYGAFGTYQSN